MECLILEEIALDVVSTPDASSFVRSIPTFFLQKCLNIDKRKSKPESLNSLSVNDDTSAIRYPNFPRKQSLDDSLLRKFPRYIDRQHCFVLATGFYRQRLRSLSAPGSFVGLPLPPPPHPIPRSLIMSVSKNSMHRQSGK